MPRYRVVVTRDTTESAVVEVEADTREAADRAAIKQAQDSGQWEQDDTPNASKHPYTNDSAELIG